MRWADCVVRALLGCYPTEFRDEYAREMAQLVRDQSAGGRRSGRDVLALAADVARTAPREHASVLLTDLRYAVRLMRRSPLFSATIVLTVALAVGANTAIFSVVNAVLLRPLPFHEPSRLVQVGEKNDKLNLQNFGASVLNYLSWQELTRTLDLGALGSGTFSLTGDGEPEQIVGKTISPSLLPLLGLRPLHGRGFAVGEDRPGAAPVAMIGEGLWKRRFGGDPSIVGRAVTLNGAGYTVVGIAPAALTMLTGGDLWAPLTIDPAREVRLNHVITVFGRLKPGVSFEQAQADMNAVAARVGQQYPEVRDWGINLFTFYRTFVSPQLEMMLLVLMSAVGFVLLIACANIANLLLARSASRQKEIAIRTAMGASRTRLLRQLLVESVFLSMVGGAAGVLAALWAVPLISRALPSNLLPVPDIPIDGTVLAFAFIATVGTGLLFGIAPSWRTAHADLNATLKQTGAAASAGGRGRLRHVLAAAELALTTVLLIGAGLLIQTFVQLQRARLGFEPDKLLTFQLAPPQAKYPLNTKAPALYRAVAESLRTIPGVRSAAVSSGIPFGSGNYTTTAMVAVGPSAVSSDAGIPIEWRIVSPGFFRTLGIPLLRGRDFTDGDDAATDLPMVVSEGTARRFWGTDDPIGRSLRQAGESASDPRRFVVVGVVGDVRSTRLNQESPALYLASARRVWPLMDVVVRTDGEPHAILPTVRQRMREIDPQLPLATVRTMDEWLSTTAARPRLNAALIGIFAAVALLVAAIGVYGVLAYSVNQRTREIGLRMALGAPRAGVLRLVIAEGMQVGLTGVAVGLAAASALSRALSTLVFGVAVHDPATFAGVAGTIALVALGACTIPARRASRVDPIIALRED